jgi:hypothetical protein
MEKNDFLNLIYITKERYNMKEVKKCEYRNCGKELDESKRVDAKFCNTSCRKQEQTYRKRKKALIEKYAEKEMKFVNNFKNILKLLEGGTQK